MREAHVREGIRRKRMRRKRTVVQDFHGGTNHSVTDYEILKNLKFSYHACLRLGYNGDSGFCLL